MMNDRPEDRVATTTEPRPTDDGEGLSTADIASGRTNLKPDDQPDQAEQARGTSETTPLFATDDAQNYRSRWSEIQTGFVDDPRHAVEQADSLVAEVMKRLAESFAGERSRLEQQWDRGDQADTENLRMALQRYRSFFGRLLSM
jgi:hypothetical protein